MGSLRRAPATGLLALVLLPAAMLAVPAASGAQSLDAAQHIFYSGKYEEAAAMALALRQSAPEDLALFELRTSALHFQMKRLLGDPEDKGKALKACAPCGDLLADFMKDVHAAQAIARAKLESSDDIPTRFYLGKIDLNYVWMQLGTLGKKTGWGEYWEARKSLDAVLKREPNHVRARVARAWIDYIVDTKVAWGMKWLLGGGSRKRALEQMRLAAADTTAGRSVRAEARFALWEMLVREKKIPDAVGVVRELAQEYPENADIQKFLAKNGKSGGPSGPAALGCRN